MDSRTWWMKAKPSCDHTDLKVPRLHGSPC